MVIGLYDQDLRDPYHYVPNLELMKVFNYHHKKGDIVKLIVDPDKEELGRYNQIWYFKNNFNTQFNQTILAQENVIVYGQGLQKNFIPLPPQYSNVKPNFLVYSLLIKEPRHLTKTKKNGIIRLENQDFTGLRSDRRDIYVVDKNPLEISNAYHLCEQFKNHKIHFLRQAIANDLDTFLLWYKAPFLYSNQKIVIKFNYDYDFFVKYCKSKKAWFGIPSFQENNKDFDIFVVQLIKELHYCLHHKISPPFEKTYFDNEILTLLFKWAFNYRKTNESCYNYYINKIEDFPKGFNAIEKYCKNKPEIRQLLKINPREVKI